MDKNFEATRLNLTDKMSKDQLNKAAVLANNQHASMSKLQRSEAKTAQSKNVGK